MDHQVIAAAAKRQIVEIEKRIAQQWALIEDLTGSDRDASQEMQTLRILERTLALTREHVSFLLRDRYQRSARLMIAHLGPHALARAEERAAICKLRADVDRAIKWTRITEAIREIQEARAEGFVPISQTPIALAS